MNYRTSLALLAGSALLVMACSGSVDTTAQGTSGGGSSGSGAAGAGGSGTAGSGAAGGQTGTGGDGGSLQLPCSVDDHTAPDYMAYECPLPSPCDTVLINDPTIGGTGGGSTEIQNPEAAVCVLENLRDRTLSSLRFEINPGGIYTTSTTIFVLDSQHAAANRYYAADLTTTYTTLYHELLKPPSYFDGCSKLDDDTMIESCLQQWSDGCADIGGVPCPQ